MTARKTERGQALIIIVLGIIGLVGAVALAVDGGNVYSERQRAQNAADSASLAGALARINGRDWVAVTLQTAATNGFNNDGTSNTVQIYSPPADGPFVNNIEYIQVQIFGHTRTYFAAALGITALSYEVEAVARTVTPKQEPIANGAAVVSLAPTSDCAGNIAFSLQGQATLEIWGGGVFDNSHNPTCAMVQRGNGGIRLQDAGQEIQIVGGLAIAPGKSSLLSPFPPHTGALAIQFPPPFFMPTVSCTVPAKILADGHSMSAGSWDQPFPPPGVDTLQSGNYCLGQDFVVNGNAALQGSNVAFYVRSGSVRFDPAARINLTARPSSDKDAGGVLIYQDANDHNPMVLDGDATSSYQGTILAPGAQIRIQGPASTVGYHSQIIGYTIDVAGSADIPIHIVSSENYQALTQPSIEFSK